LYNSKKTNPIYTIYSKIKKILQFYFSTVDSSLLHKGTKLLLGPDSKQLKMKIDKNNTEELQINYYLK